MVPGGAAAAAAVSDRASGREAPRSSFDSMQDQSRGVLPSRRWQSAASNPLSVTNHFATHPRLLKNWTARSCRSAADRLLNVPRFLRLPVLGSAFREYNRYLPDPSLRIIS
jgi:hypothetical protein